MPVRVRALFAGVIGSGAVVLAWAIAHIGAAPPAEIALIAAAFATGLLIVELSTVSAESVTYAVVVAALLQFGPAAAITVAAAGEIGSALRPPLPRPHRSSYNIAAHAIAGAAQGLLFTAAGGHPGALSLGSAALALPGSLLYFAMSSGLVALGIGWERRTDPLATWEGSFRWLAPHYPALAVAGVVLARGQEAAGPLGVLVFCLPLLMSHYSVDVFVRRTRGQMDALEKANSRLEAVNADLTQTLASVVDARDLYLYRHSHQASLYTERIARRLALPDHEVQLAKQAALLHDIGKVGIPEGILRKPGPLDDSERAIMNSHSEIGAAIVAGTHELAALAPMVRAHHERYDGGGYPDGLSGDRIPIGARIVCVLECFDAMISDRPYRKGMSPATAIDEIKRCSGTQFDPRVVRAFLAIIREEGTAWLTNSAADATASGADLFLPKGLATSSTDAPVSNMDWGESHEHDRSLETAV